MESLKDKTAKGLFWGGVSNGIQQLLGMLFGIILGRLLSPSDYGMTAMIVVFAQIAGLLQDSGFKVGVINLKNATHKDYNAIFWFDILMGGFIYIVLFFCSPFIAEYYHTPELTALCRYSFLGFVIAGWGCAPSAYMFKNIMAKQQAKSGMLSVLISCITGVILAYEKFGYWAIATQTLVFSLVNTIMLWHYSKWRPSMHIDFSPIKSMFRFSFKMLLTQAFTSINNNILNIILGRYYNSRVVGNFNQAYQWDSKGFYVIQGMVNQVAQPVFSGTNDEKERQIRILRKMMRFTAFISFPLMFGLALVSREFIIITITAKWINSAIILQILCISGAFMPICSLLSNLIISKGKSGIFLWSTVALGLFQLVLMITLYHYGIMAMVKAYVILNVFWVFVWHFFVKRLTGYGFISMLKDMAPFCLTAAGVMAATYFITMAIGNLYLLLCCRIIMAAALYYFIMRIAKVEILNECMQFVMQKIRKPKP